MLTKKVTSFHGPYKIKVKVKGAIAMLYSANDLCLFMLNS